MINTQSAKDNNYNYLQLQSDIAKVKVTKTVMISLQTLELITRDKFSSLVS